MGFLLVLVDTSATSTFVTVCFVESLSAGIVKWRLASPVKKSTDYEGGCLVMGDTTLPNRCLMANDGIIYHDHTHLLCNSTFLKCGCPCLPDGIRQEDRGKAPLCECPPTLTQIERHKAIDRYINETEPTNEKVIIYLTHVLIYYNIRVGKEFSYGI